MDLPFPTIAVDPPRAVGARHAFAWYEEAMRLFKLSPALWCLLGFVTLAADLGVQLIPGIGIALSKVVVPLVECGMFIGAAALDRGRPLSPKYSYAAFFARPGAVAAIVVSGLAVFAAEALAVYFIAGENLLIADPQVEELSSVAVYGSVAIAALASLPVAFVPFAALLSDASFADAFGASMRGFALNVTPLLIYAGLAVLLVILGLLLFGVGLIAVYPLVSAASYAAWKDIFPASAGKV